MMQATTYRGRCSRPASSLHSTIWQRQGLKFSLRWRFNISRSDTSPALAAGTDGAADYASNHRHARPSGQLLPRNSFSYSLGDGKSSSLPETIQGAAADEA